MHYRLSERLPIARQRRCLRSRFLFALQRPRRCSLSALAGHVGFGYGGGAKQDGSRCQHVPYTRPARYPAALS